MYKQITRNKLNSSKNHSSLCDKPPSLCFFFPSKNVLRHTQFYQWSGWDQGFSLCFPTGNNANLSLQTGTSMWIGVSSGKLQILSMVHTSFPRRIPGLRPSSRLSLSLALMLHYKTNKDDLTAPPRPSPARDAELLWSLLMRDEVPIGYQRRFPQGTITTV